MEEMSWNEISCITRGGVNSLFLNSNGFSVLLPVLMPLTCSDVIELCIIHPHRYILDLIGNNISNVEAHGNKCFCFGFSNDIVVILLVLSEDEFIRYASCVSFHPIKHSLIFSEILIHFLVALKTYLAAAAVSRKKQKSKQK